MTEKRFEFIGSYLYDEKESIGTINDNDTIVKMENIMNDMDSEIKTLNHLLQVQTDFLKFNGLTLKDLIEFLEK